MSSTKRCRVCGNDFQPTAHQLIKSDFSCLLCRRESHGQWRAKRKAQGLPEKRKQDLTIEMLRATIRYDSETGTITRLTATGEHKAPCRPNKGGYRQITLFGRHYCFHRIAWFWHFGEWPTGQIDHINGDPSDNRLCNLRDVSAATNTENRRSPRRDNRSQLLGAGVTESGRYAARIRANGVRYYLGLFDTASEAHAVYLQAKRKLHVGCTL